MTALVISIIGAITALRTGLYGIWTLRQKNILGGVFVVLLAFLVLALSVRYYFIA